MKRTKLGITSAHTILKNELKFIDKWLDYTNHFDYRVLLDTGSTDGSFEYLQERAKSDPNLIIEQKTFTPWNFSIARNYNLSMIPSNTSWVFSPDLDEYFSINVLNELENLVMHRPEVTNMSCARLDLYSKEVFVGQPKHLGANKIFRYGDYKWRSRIYEHVSWIHTNKYECEIYNPNVFLIHDQDYKKADREDQYLGLLTEVWKDGPNKDDYAWCMYFLVDYYFKNQNFEMFINTAIDYIPYTKELNKKEMVKSALINFLQINPPELTIELKNKILKVI